MLDKKLIFRRINFIVFISYSLLSILNDLNITTIPLPIDLSVCIVLFLCFNSIFEQNNDSHKNNKLWKFHCHVILAKCKDHLILIEGVEFSCHEFTIFIPKQKCPSMSRASKHLIQSKIQTKRHRSRVGEKASKESQN